VLLKLSVCRKNLPLFTCREITRGFRLPWLRRTQFGAFHKRSPLVAPPNLGKIRREPIDSPLFAKSCKAPCETFTCVSGVGAPVALGVEVPKNHTLCRECFPTAEVQSHREFFCLSPQN
jgi:hypothetical protein